MFELAEQGYGTPFQQLVACVISIRTRDEESLPISVRLFEAAATGEGIRRAHLRIRSTRSSRHRPSTSARRIRSTLSRRARLGVWRSATVRRRGAAIVRGGRTEVRPSGTGHRLRGGSHQRRYPCPPRGQPLGIRADHDPGADDAGTGAEAFRSATGCGSTVCWCPFGKHVCTGVPEMLDLPCPGHVPAGGGDEPPVGLRSWTSLPPLRVLRGGSVASSPLNAKK